MKERPILFSAPMVRALLAGTKTVTRRLLKPRHDFHVEDGVPFFEAYVYGEPESPRVPCPYGEPGDRFWVREAFRTSRDEPVKPGAEILYPACLNDYDRKDKGPWRPSIHIPRWASRITLEVTGVRAERLHDITEEGARSEGVEPFVHPAGAVSYRDGFANLWNDINGETMPFDENPWVWVVSFKAVAP